MVFFFSSRRRHTRSLRDWSSDVCSSDLVDEKAGAVFGVALGQAHEVVAALERVDRVVRGMHPGDVELLRGQRSEERRVGKECRSRWWACHEKKTYHHSKIK